MLFSGWHFAETLLLKGLFCLFAFVSILGERGGVLFGLVVFCLILFHFNSTTQ